ncbi:MAG TPA: DUF2970 domain-containing protein [Nevskiaceae bacterium]|nr:DUF2970 domain-containing protein [Nevskiaceae bacterium]
MPVPSSDKKPQLPTEENPASAGAPNPAPDKEASPKRLNFWQTIAVAAMALFGVRSGEGFRRDLTYGNPVHFVFAGFILFLIGVAVLWGLVHVLLWYLLKQQGIT